MRPRLTAALLAAALLHAAAGLAQAPPAATQPSAAQPSAAQPSPAQPALPAAPAESRCFGTYAQGRIEDAVRLPITGPNYAAYSTAGTMIGRTYVHTTVARIVTDTYAALHKALPGHVFVYGETGAPTGGRFRPRRSHQNGLSVDFFVPVREVEGPAAGRPVPLPTDTPGMGYDIDFDASGRYGNYAIDFETMAEHLYRLDAAAHAHGSGIALVMFSQALLPKLFATARGPWLKQHVPFMQGGQHAGPDEHYHVDFALRCAPLPADADDRASRRRPMDRVPPLRQPDRAPAARPGATTA